MRKKIKKYNPGGTTPGGSFLNTLLNNLGSVPVNGGVTGNTILGGNIDPSMVASLSMQQFANANVAPNAMGDYRRGSAGAFMDNGVSGQFNFMNQFLANQNSPATPPSINTDPFQFMPQVGLQNQMDADDQALQPAGPINTAGPQVGMPVSYRQPSAPAPVTGTPAAGLPANEPFNFQMPSLPGVTAPQGMLSGPGGINLGAVSGLGIPTPENQVNPFGNQKFFPGSFEADQMMMTGVNFADQQLALPENEFDQAQSTITKAKKAGNLIARGRDAVQHARTVKKVADVANASSDVSSLLGNLSAQGAGEVAKQGAKSGVGQFIANAGASKFGTFLSSGAGAAASAGAGIVGKAIQELDKKDGNFSTAGAMGGGALQGAAIGSALGPVGTVVGGAIGAGVGLMQKSKFEANARSQELTEKFEDAQAKAKQQLAGRAILNTFPVQGIKEQVYNLGGETEPALEPVPAPLVKEPEAIAGAMPTALELAAAQQMNRMVDPRTKQIMTESHPLAADYIDNDLMNIDKRTWFNSQLEDNPKARPAWSAATVSKLMTEAYPGFKGSMAHAGYMKDVLFGDNPANFDAKRTSMRSNFQPGTVLTRGRGDNTGQNFHQLKQTVKPFDGSKTIPTHGAVIIGSFTDANGNTMYQVQGGNESSGGPEGTETLGLKTMSAKKIRDQYPMALVPPKMKHGGHTNDPDYLAEGGEMIQHAPGDLPKTDNNGSVTPITKTIARINGDKHSASSGGVGMEGKESARIYSDQLHVPADLVAQLSKL